ncbi:hypothetical protein ACFP2F_12310 [Hymenobacter artigasi]|uniref:DUF4476 domain-containing protein n=1 Tax=Hymenobacter artigasi TaxID=2719616 RepID=A0ABX1HJQ7_9BACT|nr:hypothetical protein [Hymenobacter artigasi]NKI89387.1 hypothetical protein [Hymenobacter artigasi]
MSCQVAKPTFCPTEIVVNYQGPTDKPISPLVFTMQESNSKSLHVASAFDYRRTVIVSRNEFEIIGKTIEKFNNVASDTKATADIQSFGVLIAESCKQRSYGTYGRNNSIRFLLNLLETTEKFRPEVKAPAKEFITSTRNRLGN